MIQYPFPVPNRENEVQAFSAAVEAMVGLTIQGKTVNQEAVDDWLEVTIEGRYMDDDNILNMAKHYAKRMMNGPER